MKTLTPPAASALSGSVLKIVQLIYMDFPGLPVAFNSDNADVVFAGVTYKGAAGLGSISPIDDSPGEIKGLQFSMSGISTDYLALALDDAGVVQGTMVTVRLAIMSGPDVLDAPIDWVGRLDTMTIEEDGDTCTIAASAESTAVDLLRGFPLTYSNVDQQFLYPGDRAFEYVLPQNRKPIVWGGKQWLLALNGR